jgi:hypothetical protein
MAKILRRRGCNSVVIRRGARDSGPRLGDQVAGCRGREEEKIVFALVVSLLVIMFQILRHDAS